MKIKIIGEVKAGNPWKPQDKPWTLYSVYADITADGKEHKGATLKTLSERINSAVLGGTLKEFDAEYKEREFTKRDGTKATACEYNIDKNALGNQNNGGWKGKSNYQPRVYISGKQYHELCKWCYTIAKELDEKNAAVLFDKILGTASVLLDLSKYTNKQQEVKKEGIRTATEKDIQKADSDPHAGLTDELSSETMNSIPSDDFPF